jgi:hypothetical protein
MRIGVNSGLAMVRQIRGESAAMTALGDTVNLASRSAQLIFERIRGLISLTSSSLF